MSAHDQWTIFRGIYEYEDPSGCLLAAKVPVIGSADLFDGTVIVVKPSQCAIFIYNGQVADILFSGMHTINSDNVPLLTRLASWKFGFESPLRCQLVFVSGHVLTARRWGTTQPILVNIDSFGTVPIRSYGNFNVSIINPKEFFLKLMGSRISYSINDLEEFIQGQIVEILPEVFSTVSTFEQLALMQNELSKNLEIKLNHELQVYGIACQKIQILSALPSREVISALDAKAAINIIGSQREYLLYKAANGLGEDSKSIANDPMQMMLGLMLGKGLMGADYHDKEETVRIQSKAVCASCGHRSELNSIYCSQCGKKV